MKSILKSIRKQMKSPDYHRYDALFTAQGHMDHMEEQYGNKKLYSAADVLVLLELVALDPNRKKFNGSYSTKVFEDNKKYKFSREQYLADCDRTGTPVNPVCLRSEYYWFNTLDGETIKVTGERTGVSDDGYCVNPDWCEEVPAS